jgi:hypothetical protein
MRFLIEENELGQYRRMAHVIYEEEYEIPRYPSSQEDTFVYHLVMGAMSPTKTDSPELTASFDVFVYRDGNIIAGITDLPLVIAKRIHGLADTLAKGLLGQLKDEEEGEDD